MEIEPDDAIVIVLIPKGKPITKSHGRLIADDTVVDYSIANEAILELAPK